MAVSATQVQEEFTKRWSTLRYRIEFKGYFANHLLHGVVALFDLGANMQKIEEFAESYATKLEKETEDIPSDQTHDTKLTFESARQLLGKRTKFQELLTLYAGEVQELGIDKAIQKHLPILIGGLAGALFHCIIQLGYAYHIGGNQLVAEGLTYMHYAYLSFDEPKQSNNDELSSKKILTREEVVQVLQTLQTSELLQSEMRYMMNQKPLMDRPIGMIPTKLATMSGDSERGSNKAFHMIWNIINDFDHSQMDGVFALDLALWVYMMIEHNDFVILHAVTSAWALQQVEHLLEPKDRVRSWKVWLHVTLSAFATNEIQDLLPRDICECINELPGLNSWSEIIDQTLNLTNEGSERDVVHAYKLVQVAHNHSQCGKNSILNAEERDFIARKSALKAISCNFEHR